MRNASLARLLHRYSMSAHRNKLKEELSRLVGRIFHRLDRASFAWRIPIVRLSP
jgi:hypothetical protein